jgi:hypothetical protein
VVRIGGARFYKSKFGSLHEENLTVLQVAISPRRICTTQNV